MRIHIFYLPESFFDLFFSVFIHQIVRYLMNKNEEKDRKKRKDDLIVFFIGKFKQTLNTQNFNRFLVKDYLFNISFFIRAISSR